MSAICSLSLRPVFSRCNPSLCGYGSGRLSFCPPAFFFSFQTRSSSVGVHKDQPWTDHFKSRHKFWTGLRSRWGVVTWGYFFCTHTRACVCVCVRMPLDHLFTCLSRRCPTVSIITRFRLQNLWIGVRVDSKTPVCRKKEAARRRGQHSKVFLAEQPDN